jgi:hypothetical protein
MNFVKDALERALKTGAQAAVASFGVSATSLYDLNFATSAGVTGFAVLVSLLTSLASRRVGDSDSASLVK